MRSRTFARSAVTSLAAAGIALTAGTAHASGPDLYIPITGGHAEFKTYGDHLYISDTRKDGNSVVTIVEAGTKYFYWNKDGEGTTRHVNLNLHENVTYAFRVCRANWQGTPNEGILWDTCNQKQTEA